MNPLVVRQSLRKAVKTGAVLFVGRIIRRAISLYQLYCSIETHPSYQNRSPRRTEEGVAEIDGYSDLHGPRYKREQLAAEAALEEMSEYYLFKLAEPEARAGRLAICDVGCLYCGAAGRFLDKFPGAEFFGLDFGRIDELNADLRRPQLKLFPGYPLETIEGFAGRRRFDYLFFTRTATLMNPRELRAYLRAAAKVAERVCFLEPVKLTGFPGMELDIASVDPDDPPHIYSGMYIHNYPALLRDAGFEVVDARIIPPGFFKQDLTDDHYFVYVRGKNSKLTEGV
jgi:hypothetical protein